MESGPLVEECNETDGGLVQFLCRYRPFTDEFNSSERILSENLWWFASRTGFDDTLDCVLGGTKLTSRGIEQIVRESGGTDLDVRKALNDSSLSKRVPNAVQRNSIDTVGILCLSELLDDPKLWRDYARRGHGISLCLEKEKLDGCKYKPQVVQYLDTTRHIWNPDAEDQLAETSASVLRKSSKWEYQREWRIFWSGGVGYHQMPTDSLRAVILGARLSEAKRRRIVRWTQSGPWNPMPAIIPSRCPR
jgi:hypothetical protein